MMIHTARTLALFLICIGLAMSVRSTAVATDPPPKPAAVITFADMPAGMNVKYHLKCEIDFIGDKKSVVLNTTTESGVTGPGYCVSVEHALKGQRGWEFDVEKATLTIQGWRDPKSGVFYPVKKVTFTSDDLPKESLPKVTYIGSKA